MILGIETSCDETAAALVSPDGRILSSVVSSQADLHARFHALLARDFGPAGAVEPVYGRLPDAKALA